MLAILMYHLGLPHFNARHSKL